MNDTAARDRRAPRAGSPPDEERFDDDLSEELEEDLLEETSVDAVDPVGPDADEATDGPVGLTPDDLPDSPNEDMSNLASPRSDVGMQRLSDDDDLDPSGSVTFGPHMRGVYEAMARRDEIARRVDELLVEVEEWAEEDGSDEAREILEALEDVADRLGEPPEDSDT
ncbi:MAG TPA: hypothetical protein VF202_12905 [Trueperaceae bacterium]|jgi:hypothetical protein